MIDQEESLEKLEAVQAVLSGEEDYTSPSWEKEELIRRAKRSEEDIKAGRVYTLEEAKARMASYLKDRMPK